MIAPGWFVKTEYRYAELQFQNTRGSHWCRRRLAILTSINMTVKPQVQTIRSELVYKFNWGR